MGTLKVFPQRVRGIRQSAMSEGISRQQIAKLIVHDGLRYADRQSEGGTAGKGKDPD
jgi:hypothetical protein